MKVALRKTSNLGSEVISAHRKKYPRSSSLYSQPPASNTTTSSFHKHLLSINHALVVPTPGYMVVSKTDVAHIKTHLSSSHCHLHFSKSCCLSGRVNHGFFTFLFSPKFCLRYPYIFCLFP